MARYPSRSRLWITAPASKVLLRSRRARDAFSPNPIARASSCPDLSRRLPTSPSGTRRTMLPPARAWRKDRNKYPSRSLSPEAMRPPVVEGFGEVLDCDVFLPGQVRDGPCYPEHAVVAPAGEAHPVDGAREQGLRVPPQAARGPQHPAGQRAIRDALPLGLRLPGPAHALPYDPGRLAYALPPELLAREARHVHEEVHAVDEGARDARPVAFDLAGRAPARPPPVPRVPAGTRVHGTHERHPRRVTQRRRHPRDGDVPVFERLAQHLERPATELGELVEEEDPVVRERDLAGPRVAPPTGEPRRRDRVVWCPKGPVPDQGTVRLAACAVDLRHLDPLGTAERGKYAWHAPREHGLAGPGRTTHERKRAVCNGQSPPAIQHNPARRH